MLQLPDYRLECSFQGGIERFHPLNPGIRAFIRISTPCLVFRMLTTGFIGCTVRRTVQRPIFPMIDYCFSITIL
jgi:hypothetical protein